MLLQVATCVGGLSLSGHETVGSAAHKEVWGLVQLAKGLGSQNNYYTLCAKERGILAFQVCAWPMHRPIPNTDQAPLMQVFFLLFRPQVLLPSSEPLSAGHWSVCRKLERHVHQARTRQRVSPMMCRAARHRRSCSPWRRLRAAP